MHLQIPHLSIDEIFWNPGWVPTQPDVLQAQVQKFIESNPEGWIIDGNYRRVIGPIVQDAATDVLCERVLERYILHSTD
jgi:adenylate kinase family enzyme